MNRLIYTETEQNAALERIKQLKLEVFHNPALQDAVEEIQLLDLLLNDYQTRQRTPSAITQHIRLGMPFKLLADDDIAKEAQRLNEKSRNLVCYK